MRVSDFTDVVNSGFCTGCGACAGLLGSESARMKMSSQGYLRPEIFALSSTVAVQRARAACTGLQMFHDSETLPYHRIWGPLHTVRTAHASDPDIRRQGSSGGVISALAVHLLESGQVDFVAQIAVAEDDPLVNRVQQSRTRSDVLRAAGSRYAPAAPLDRIEAFLASGERFAFIGKPCDVAALRALARVDPRVSRQVPFMISFMCAGVPSIDGTHALLRQMGVEPDDVEQFRYRGDGWPGMARAVTREGRVAETDYNSSWGTVLNRYLQYRCKICPDGTGEFADVVCADAWYGADGYPDFQERDGRSLLLSRTPAGEALVASALGSHAIDASGLQVDEIAAMQPYQVNRKQMVLGRLAATALRTGRIPIFRRMGLIKASLSAHPLAWLRSAWGSFKRAGGESV